MTLIVTALSDEVIVQAADRRLTRDGELCDDLAIKSICVSCMDASFTMAYTGVADIQGKRTDEWVVDYLTSTHASQRRFVEIVGSFKEQLSRTSRTLRYLGRRRAITCSIAGFGTPGPFAVWLSNMEDSKGNLLNKIDDDFQVGFLRRNNAPLRKLDMVIHGAEEAIDPLEVAISKIRKRYYGKDPNNLAVSLVQIIRRAANDPRYGHLIGRNCISTVVKRNRTFSCQDHSEVDSPQEHMPHAILGGNVFKNTELWTGPDVPPWWSARHGE